MNLPRLLSLFLLLVVAVSAARADVTEQISRTYPLPADGVIRLENVNGNITIIAWDRNEVSLEAEKRGRDEEDLKRITVDIDAQPGRLTVKATIAKAPGGWLSGKGSRAAVRFELRVPRQAHLEQIGSVNASINVEGVRGPMTLKAVNGAIRATDLAADTEIESVNGSITAEFASLEKVQKVDLESVNGRVNVTLPPDASARIEARTTNGRTSIEQAITLKESSRRKLSGSIGSGDGPLVRAETTNGSVSIRER